MQRLKEDEFVAESGVMRRGARRAMGARMYMPEIGRFLSVDPLAEAFPTQSPYNFAYNNPINFRDPSGLAPEKEKGDRVLKAAVDPNLEESFQEYAHSLFVSFMSVEMESAKIKAYGQYLLSFCKYSRTGSGATAPGNISSNGVIVSIKGWDNGGPDELSSNTTYTVITNKKWADMTFSEKNTVVGPALTAIIAKQKQTGNEWHFSILELPLDEGLYQITCYNFLEGKEGEANASLAKMPAGSKNVGYAHSHPGESPDFSNRDVFEAGAGLITTPLFNATTKGFTIMMAYEDNNVCMLEYLAPYSDFISLRDLIIDDARYHGDDKWTRGLNLLNIYQGDPTQLKSNPKAQNYRGILYFRGKVGE